MWDIGEAAGRPDWRVLDTWLSCNLYAVVVTVEGPFAVESSDPDWGYLGPVGYAAAVLLGWRYWLGGIEFTGPDG